MGQQQKKNSHSLVPDQKIADCANDVIINFCLTNHKVNYLFNSPQDNTESIIVYSCLVSYYI